MQAAWAEGREACSFLALPHPSAHRPNRGDLSSTDCAAVPFRVTKGAYTVEAISTLFTNLLNLGLTVAVSIAAFFLMWLRCSTVC